MISVQSITYSVLDYLTNEYKTKFNLNSFQMDGDWITVAVDRWGNYRKEIKKIIKHYK